MGPKQILREKFCVTEVGGGEGGVLCWLHI